MTVEFVPTSLCLTLSLRRDSLKGRDVRAMGAVGFGNVESAIVL